LTMAKIIEDVLVIKFSKIVRDNDTDPAPAVTNDHIAAMVEVAQELVGSAVIVEVERA
jgi:hypothetical protein